MHDINIYLQSKHKNYIYQFITLFNKKSRTLFRCIKLRFIKQACQPLVSILTSPHVNKKAQEQFKIKMYSLQLKVKTFELLKFIILFKRLSVNLLPNINLKIKIRTKMALKKVCSFSYLKRSKKSKTLPYFRQKGLLKIIENYGV
jgi:ribosomal protein S10